MCHYIESAIASSSAFRFRELLLVSTEYARNPKSIRRIGIFIGINERLSDCSTVPVLYRALSFELFNADSKKKTRKEFNDYTTWNRTHSHILSEVPHHFFVVGTISLSLFHFNSSFACNNTERELTYFNVKLLTMST